ncbi:hypothetical protein ElyMa_006730900 [Elysia marginata]|uniref:Uncharacterized protein n=1 Tax=Elysia marginata TaxID=1093978 RepID=A0AAV4IYF5_9GAST|nr:hypothetical protein ElyMa_006730900 [Elysia marginata]
MEPDLVQAELKTLSGGTKFSPSPAATTRRSSCHCLPEDYKVSNSVISQDALIVTVPGVSDSFPDAKMRAIVHHLGHTQKCILDMRVKS